MFAIALSSCKILSFSTKIITFAALHLFDNIGLAVHSKLVLIHYIFNVNGGNVLCFTFM